MSPAHLVNYLKISDVFVTLVGLKIASQRLSRSSQMSDTRRSEVLKEKRGTCQVFQMSLFAEKANFDGQSVLQSECFSSRDWPWAHRNLIYVPQLGVHVQCLETKTLFYSAAAALCSFNRTRLAANTEKVSQSPKCRHTVLKSFMSARGCSSRWACSHEDASFKRISEDMSSKKLSSRMQDRW